MTTKAKAVGGFVAALLVVATAYSLLSPRDDVEQVMANMTNTPAPDAAPIVPPDPVLPETPSVSETPPPAVAEETPPPAPVAPAPTPTPESLRPVGFHVFWDDTKADAAGTTLTLCLEGSYVPGAFQGATNDDGLTTVGIPFDWDRFLVWNENPEAVPWCGQRATNSEQPIPIPLQRDITVFGQAWIENESRPAAGARISQENTLYEAQTAIADENGQFEIRRLPQKDIILVATLGPYRSDASPAKAEPLRLSPGMTRYGPHTIVLQRGATISGEVRDKATGESIAGARIFLDVGKVASFPMKFSGKQTGRGFAYSAIEVDLSPPNAVTDEAGRFWIEGRKAGSCWVTVCADGYQKDDRGVALAVAESTECDFALDRGASVVGYVEWDGKRRSAADVAISQIDADTGRAMKKETPPPRSVAVKAFAANAGVSNRSQAGLAKTDDFGEFSFHGLAPGVYRAQASGKSLAQGETWTIAKRLQLAPAEEKFLPLTDTEGQAGLHGIVRAENKPVEGADLRVRPKFDWEFEEFRINTGPNGRYQIFGLRDGEYEISVGKYPSTGRYLSAGGPVTVRGFTELDLDFAVSHLVTARLKIKEDAPESFQKGRIHASLKHVAPDTPNETILISDRNADSSINDGVLHFEGVFQGDYRVELTPIFIPDTSSLGLVNDDPPPYELPTVYHLDNRSGDQDIGEIVVDGSIAPSRPLTFD